MLKALISLRTEKSRLACFSIGYSSGKTITFLVAILLFAFLTRSQAQNTWTQKADFVGPARRLAVGFSIGNLGYIGTGDNGAFEVGDFWEYNPDADTWTQKANFGGGARAYATGFSIGSKGYLGTGLHYDGTFKKDFWEYDPTSNTWTQKADFGGNPRARAVGFSIGNKGYIGTGFIEDPSYHSYKDFWEYDPDQNTWTQKAHFGGGVRSYATGFSIGSKGYLGTGYNDDLETSDFWEYSPNNNTWTKKTDFGGVDRYGATGFSIGSKGYLGTGVNYFTYGITYKDFWEYDSDANSWTQLSDFGGDPRFAAAGFSIGTKCYLGTGDTYTKDFWEYTPDSVVTCNIPTSLSIVNVTPTTAKLQWNAETNAIGYKVYYHPAIVPQGIEKPSKTNSKLLKNLTPNTKYKWAVQSICGTQPLIESPFVMGPDFTTPPLRLDNDVNTTFEMKIFPNPASENAIISFSLNEESPVAIEIMDVNGRSLRVIADQNFSEGSHQVTFSRESVIAGIYFLQIKTNEGVMMKKMVLLH